MTSFETSATVDAQGEVHVVGVPFAPGTSLEIVLSPKAPIEKGTHDADAERLAAARDRIKDLFAALDKARNAKPVGPLNRDELYDRDVLP